MPQNSKMETLREVVAMSQFSGLVRILSPLGPRKKFRKLNSLKIEFPEAFVF